VITRPVIGAAIVRTSAIRSASIRGAPVSNTAIRSASIRGAPVSNTAIRGASVSGAGSWSADVGSDPAATGQRALGPGRAGGGRWLVRG
jgi:hypothetical protein